MKVTIVSPKIYTYGPLILGGILKERGHTVTITRDLRSDGEATLLSLFSTSQLLDPEIRKFAKSCPQIYVGGPVGLVPEIVLGELEVDAVVMGEGEEVVARVVEKGPSAEIPGVAFHQEGKVVKTKPEPVEPLDHVMPLIPEDLKSQNVRGANVYIETHRGCLGGCTFCQVPRFFGRSIRSRSLENILDEVREMKRMGVSRVAVSGGTGSLFGYGKEVNKEAFITLLRSLAEILGPRNLSVPDMRVDFVDEEILEAVRRYTIGWVFFGIESGSEKMLKKMKKGTTPEKNLEAVELAHSCGVKVGGSFIVGYPGESEEDYQATLDFMDEAMLEDVFSSVAEPIPGTPLARLALDYPKGENLLYQDHLGDYRALKLSEAEARCFNLMLHGQNCKLIPKIVDDRMYSAFLEEARTQGRDVRRVMDLLEKYKDHVA
ncbi:MAG TPA: TIGR04014 family B12-binding domain/radical SAM domain-containing protein [Methanotrichaceae archaeon]|nr:TIGR04014 family B12-binding domain/radical SAM domain-containing protein [Methanotrichaceae archaeon]